MGFFDFLKPNKDHLNKLRRRKGDIKSVEKKELAMAQFPNDYIKGEIIKKEAERIAKEAGADGKAFYNLKQLNEFLKEQKDKGLDFFDGRWIKKEEVSKLKEIQFDLDNNFNKMSPFEFEQFIAKLFKAMGYKTIVTKKTGDYGIDVIAEKDDYKVAIQVKKYNIGHPVGNREVQMLLGAMQKRGVKATHSILVTTSHFTVQAKEQAKECAVELWDKNILQKMVKKYLMQIE